MSKAKVPTKKMVHSPVSGACAADKALVAPPHILNAIRALRKLGSPQLDALSGDANYSNRVQLLKILRKTDKVLVKTSGITTLVKEFYAAVGVKQASAAAMSDEFTRLCTVLYREASKAASSARKSERVKIADAMRATLPERIVIDDKPVLPVYKPPTKAQRKAADDAKIREVVAKAAAVQAELEEHPIATPRPDARVQLIVDDVCLLEDPNNGIVLMRLEKPNSQGAICVYNNGRCVAAGVVPPDALATMRILANDDLVGAANQLLKPLTASVVVKPAAERHLTALIAHFKENASMSTAPITIRKFGPPAKSVPAKKSIQKELAEIIAAPAPAKVTPIKVAAKPAIVEIAAKPAAVKAASKTAPAKTVPAKTVPAKTVPAKTVPAKLAAKPVPAKLAAKTASVKTAPVEVTGSRHVRSIEGKKITVLRRDHEYRKGSKLQIGFDILLKAKNTDDALAKFAQEGVERRVVYTAITSGFISLH